MSKHYLVPKARFITFSTESLLCLSPLGGHEPWEEESLSSPIGGHEPWEEENLSSPIGGHEAWSEESL